MRYFIYAYEAQYGGLHGMCNHVVDEYDSYSEACETAMEMAMDVIESYQCTLDAYEDIEDDDERYDAMVEDCCYEMWGIREEFQNLTCEELDSIAFDIGEDEFVREYCEELV